MNDKVERYREKLEKNHNIKYDYSKVCYNKTVDKVIIGCPVHGDFIQQWADHLLGRICPECSKEKRISSQYSTTEDFVKKSKEKFGDKFDYSKTVYKGYREYLIVTCKKHGDIRQKPVQHFRSKYGCKKCSDNNISDNLQSFIKKAINKHGHKFDYSNVNYISSKDKVSIICPDHGEFFYRPNDHLENDHGCPTCGMNSSRKSMLMTLDEFISKANKIHKNKFDYSNVVYENNKIHVEIICDKGHRYKQTPNAHLSGNGCHICSIEQTSSKSEKELLSFINSIYSGYILENTRSIISPYELDIFIPNLNLAIEFNGLYYHSELFKDKNYHNMKRKLCSDKNIRLVQIWEYEWIEKQELCKAFVTSLLVQPIRLYVRKLSIKTVSVDEQRNFLNLYHFQGYASASTVIGLYNGNELIQLMSFKKLNQTGDYEIGRLCTKSGYAVVGGSERLYKALISKTSPKSLISYNNLDKFTGEVYSKLGLRLEKEQIDSYFYHKGQQAFSRQQFQKHKLVAQGHDPNLTEVEIANSMGYYRVFPTGNSKYSKKF